MLLIRFVSYLLFKVEVVLSSLPNSPLRSKLERASQKSDMGLSIGLEWNDRKLLGTVSYVSLSKTEIGS